MRFAFDIALLGHSDGLLGVVCENPGKVMVGIVFIAVVDTGKIHRHVLTPVRTPITRM